VSVKLSPHIGITPDERLVPQECSADITLLVDLEAAAATDSLDGSVDYRTVLARVQETSVAREYCLLETLAYKIARDILEAFPVSLVRIKVRKRPASLADKLDFVEVEVEQS